MYSKKNTKQSNIRSPPPHPPKKSGGQNMSFYKTYKLESRFLYIDDFVCSLQSKLHGYKTYQSK